MDYTHLYSAFNSMKDTRFSGRYLDVDLLHESILKLPSTFRIHQIGISVNQLPIYAAFWGRGKKKILAWSQMHGNETTTTKALLDLVKYFTTASKSDFVEQLSNTCELALVFVLNPDGAKAYTRVNSNQVDLNRDALQASQPEMLALHQLYNDFRPDLCLNLHGQRSIFSAGTQKNPAIVSFLSPSVNETRSVTSTRISSMQLIVEMNAMLQKFIPNQVGRYDDAYNPNCTGDYFQGLATPTILFEAGHFPDDYQREETRRLIFLCYIQVLESFVQDSFISVDYKTYFQIPKNQKLFYDIILRKVHLGKTVLDWAIQYEEVLSNQSIAFIPKLEEIDYLPQVFAHREEEIGEQVEYLNGIKTQKKPKVGSVIEEIRTKNYIYSLNIPKK